MSIQNCQLSQTNSGIIQTFVFEKRKCTRNEASASPASLWFETITHYIRGESIKVLANEVYKIVKRDALVNLKQNTVLPISLPE